MRESNCADTKGVGEAATTEIARKQDVQGFGENKRAAHKGGRIAGEAREKLKVETD
jgi:DNA-damage-inducible protein D